MKTRHLVAAGLLTTGSGFGLAGAEPCDDVDSRIDSAPDTFANVLVCPCFAPGEIAMTILDVPPGEATTLAEIRIFWASLFGGQPDSLEAAVIVYDMNQEGPADPATFVPLCTEPQGCILEGPVMQDGGLNAFDVRAATIELPPNRFGIGLEFLTDQTAGNPLFIPSVASDDDGHNNAGGVVRNWVFTTDDFSWHSSQSLEVSGDWIIRAIVEVCENPCPWDVAPIPGDGQVGVNDFLMMLSLWGTDPGGPPDFNDDGDVSVLDFLELLAHWGPCP
ncbi:MAG: hypothetical protein ACYTF2_03545 [Planctomycetota bacterium]|jgi:hypothetical protein